jgi:hypothetical protein
MDYWLANFDGNVIISREYSYVDMENIVKMPHVLGLNVSTAKKDGKWGVIDSEGSVLVPFELEESFETGYRFSDQHRVESVHELCPYRIFEAGTGRPVAVDFADDDNPPEFILSGSKGSEYFGSYLGKGAVVVLERSTTARFDAGSRLSYVNREEFTLKAPPYVSEGGFMVPLRSLCEYFRADIELEHDTGALVIKQGGQTLRLFVGAALPDGMGAPAIKSGEIFVPIRYVSDVMKYRVELLDNGNSVLITE